MPHSYRKANHFFRGITQLLMMYLFTCDKATAKYLRNEPIKILLFVEMNAPHKRWLNLSKIPTFHSQFYFD